MEREKEGFVSGEIMLKKPGSGRMVKNRVGCSTTGGYGGYKRAAKGQRGKRPGRGRAIRTALCLMLLASAAYVKFADTPFSRSALSYVNKIITFDMDFSEPFGELKFVDALFEPSAQVAAQVQQRYPMPVKGTLQQGEDGARITAKAGDGVTAIAGGKVIRRGTNTQRGNYVRLQHADGVESTYYGLKDSPLKEGDEVAQGAKVGTLLKEELYVTLSKDGKPMGAHAYFTTEESK